MINIFGSIFNVGIQGDLTNNKIWVQFKEMDRSLDHELMCNGTIFRPVQFRKHSANDFDIRAWNMNMQTSFFTFYWRNTEMTKI